MSLEQLCAHTRLSATDQTECRRQADAATTDTQRMEVRRTFEAKAGLRAGSLGPSGSGTTSGSGILDEGRAGRTGGTSAGNPTGGADSSTLQSADPTAPPRSDLK